MTRTTDEQISTLIDQCLSPENSGPLLEEVTNSELNQQTLRNYQLIGQALRHETVMLDASSVMANVSALLDDEPVILAPRNLKNSWLKKVDVKKASAGIALAASVAAISLFSFTQDEQQAKPNGFGITQIEFTKVALNTVPQPFQQTPRTHWKQLTQPEVEQHLNGYIVGHGAYAPPIAGSMMPYASFVSYDSVR